MDLREMYDKCERVITSCETLGQMEMASEYLVLTFDRAGASKELDIDTLGGMNKWFEYLIESKRLMRIFENKHKTLQGEIGEN